MEAPRRVIRAVACMELGWSCAFVARGRTPDEAVARFWQHARDEHTVDLACATHDEKDRLDDLAVALATSTRNPKSKRASTSPGMRELEARGEVRRWWSSSRR